MLLAPKYHKENRETEMNKYWSTKQSGQLNATQIFLELYIKFDAFGLLEFYWC